jgi:hypothetical protein
LKQFEYTTHIQATPQAVWDTLLAVEHWPQWTPTMKRVERIDRGPFGVGSRARIWLTGMPRSTVWEVTSLVAQRSFSWRSRLLPGVASLAEHELMVDGVETRLTLRLAWTGVMTEVLSPLLGRTSKRNLEREAEGLKRYCEPGTPAPVNA